MGIQSRRDLKQYGFFKRFLIPTTTISTKCSGCDVVIGDTEDFEQALISITRQSMDGRNNVTIKDLVEHHFRTIEDIDKCRKCKRNVAFHKRKERSLQSR